MALADSRVRVVMATHEPIASGRCKYAERIDIHNIRDACGQAIQSALGQASDR